MRQIKARGGCFKCVGCWAVYRTAAASSQNDDVMVSMFAKCKYQIGKELCPQREEERSYRE